MFGIKKLRVHTLSAITSIIFLGSCSGERSSVTIQGSTQGTTYTIIIVDDDVDVKKSEIDSIFARFDLSLSTYIDSSVISNLNQADSSITINDRTGYFKRCYTLAQKVYNHTKGSFDPSIFPLVEGWGFMNDMEEPPADSVVDSLLQYVSFQKDVLHSISFNNNEIALTKSSGFKLDFNAIAQGLSVDVVAEYLDEKGCNDYYVEIGGELRVKGKNRENVDWKIGVDTPIEDLETREVENILHLTDRSVATSGNYRKFYIKDGVKYSHTLDPKTGRPVSHNLLSATVIAENCALADAYATAIMVMGVDKGIELAKSEDVNIEVYLIYSDEEGNLKRKYSKGFDTYFE